MRRRLQDLYSPIRHSTKAARRGGTKLYIYRMPYSGLSCAILPLKKRYCLASYLLHRSLCLVLLSPTCIRDIWLELKISLHNSLRLEKKLPGWCAGHIRLTQSRISTTETREM
ncbi:hypothetical protein K449DRAFT_15745 [Hypoxylon sp. EC38]|nr:hypothetical protein K449DRAFT_15745 [Hypoxylon sp. EC38]